MSPGDQLGPYRVEARIGEGGMGGVWRATDTRLGRPVAIKVSKSAFEERFAREARAVAALNHPHICTLHDVGPNYLVMELIEGTPLRGPLPPAKAVEFASQILDALDAAHRKGFAHRDLKPANILVSRHGIKLLDFGLAKKTSPLPQGDATVTAMTGEGQVAGTLQYMAPEQLQGKADARSDLFSFGCVLYELLSGQPAFAGDSPASVIGAVLHRDPPPLAVEPPLDRVVRRCLAKDPDDRFQTPRDLAYNLKLALEPPTGQLAVPPGAASRWRLGAIAATVLLALALGRLWMDRTQPSHSTIAARFEITPPPGQEFTASLATVAVVQQAVSPDGKTIAMVLSDGSGKSRIWIRTLDNPRARPLAGTEDGAQPFWSPDSAWVGFFAQGQLKRARRDGGEAKVICDASSDSRGGTWLEDGTVLFTLPNSALYRVPATGGLPAPAVELDRQRGEVSQRWPQALPGGEFVLTTIRGSRADAWGVTVLSLKDPKFRKRLLDIDASAVTDGEHLFYPEGENLVARRFDASRLEFTSEPVTAATGVALSTTSQTGASVSRNGVLTHSGPVIVRGKLTWFSRGGRNLGTLGDEGHHPDFRFSPDGSRLLVSTNSRDALFPDVWIQDLQRGSRSRITSNPNLDASGVWSPDGSRIIFRSNRAGSLNLYECSSDGTGEKLLFAESEQFAASGQGRAGGVMS